MRVVEDDAEGVALAADEAAHPVTHRHAIRATRTLHGAVARGEDDHLALLEMHDAPARLGARSLLHEEELASREVLAGLAQEHGELEGKDDVAVEILVQAVVAVGLVAQEKRGGFTLPTPRAEREELREVGRMPHTRPERRLPAIGHHGEWWIGVLAQLGHEGRERVGKVLVLADPEAEARHVHAAPEACLVVIEGAELRALRRGEQRRRARVAPLVQGRAEGRPVETRQPFGHGSSHAASGLQTLQGRYPTERASSTEAKTTRLSERMCRPWAHPTRHTMCVLVHPSYTGVVRSRERSRLFTSVPKRYPPRPPPVCSTRWQGTMMGTGFRPSAVPTARTARGWPMRWATHA